MGQSTISTHLPQLKQAELVEDRRTGKSNFYHLGPADGSLLEEILAEAEQRDSRSCTDQTEMRRVVKKRQDKMRAFFDSVAGRMGKDYVPGRSWKGLAEALLRLMPSAGRGRSGRGRGELCSVPFAQRARKVIAVDSSARMIEVGREQAARHGVKNIEYRLGDMEEIPIADGEVELVFFSQSLHHALHPERALAEAARILAPGGRVVVLDLVKHRFEEAREMYADEWLGFSEAELEAMLENAGFANVETAVVDKDAEAPQFQTLLGTADKPHSKQA